MTAPISSPRLKPRALSARLLAAWLLVAAILSHAVLPVGSPVQRSSGSAFSAATFDVTTLPRRDKDQDRSHAAARGNVGDTGGAGAGDSPAVLVTAPVRFAPPIALPALVPPDPPSAPDASAPAAPYQARAPPVVLHA